MQHPNDILIKSISEEISKISPNLSTMLSTMQNRRKGQFIIESFPWPIGVEIRRLISGDRVIQDQNRLEQLLKTGERAIQFLAFCLVCDMWANLKKSDQKITPDLENNINDIDIPSLGTWVGLIRASSTMIDNDKSNCFFFNSNIRWKKINNLTRKFVELRNIKAHHSDTFDSNEAEIIVCDLLTEISFLTKYQMVTVRNIQVNKTRLKPAKFQHNLAVLNSTHKDFALEKVDAKEFVESQNILLLSAEQNITGTYINLFPFIIDTNPFLQDNIQLGGVNGIFLYHSIKKSKITYVGTEPIKSTNMFDWSIKQDIIDQLNNLKRSLKNE